MYKFRKVSIIVILILLLTCLKVFPQEKAINYTIEETITTAIKNSLLLAGIEQDIMASQSRVSQAETGYYPGFLSKAYYSRVHPLPSFNMGGEELELGEPDQAQIIFNLNYLIYDGGLTPNLTDERTFVKESLILEKEALRQDVIFNVIEADYNVLKAQALFNVFENNLATAQEQLKRANAFYREGLVPMADVLNAKAQVANAELDIIKAKSNIEQTKLLLKHAMYIPLTTQIELTVHIPACESLRADVTYITNLAYKNRQEIKKMETLVLAQKSAIEVARSQGKPNVYFNFDYVPASSTIFTPSNSITATVGTTIPIFDRNLTKYKVEEAEANYEKSEVSLENVKTLIELQVQQAYIELIKAEEEMVKVEETLKASEKNYKVASLRYKEGIAPFLEVTDSRALLTRAEASRVQAQYNYFIAVARIIRSAGLLPENGNLYNIKLIDNSDGKE
ncbi:MAG TPA: TolC family protein [Candidatus Eremiobacteraeota bacterium]|nr:TolC family protein [Candidatus Eremiobacteraeota bacterium]